MLKIGESGFKLCVLGIKHPTYFQLHHHAALLYGQWAKRE